MALDCPTDEIITGNSYPQQGIGGETSSSLFSYFLMDLLAIHTGSQKVDEIRFTIAYVMYSFVLNSRSAWN